MLAKRKKLNLSSFNDREQLRSFSRFSSPLFFIQFAQQANPKGAVIVSKKISNSAVERNALKRACYGVLEELFQQNNQFSWTVRLRKKNPPQKTALSLQKILIGLTNEHSKSG